MERTRKVVGVDIDGVLGDQVEGVLKRVNPGLSSPRCYEDVVDWDIQLGDSSFIPEIKKALKDQRYVLDMPVHAGATDMLEALRRNYFVRIITVRPPEAISWTEQWLINNDLPYDELVPAEEAQKSRHDADVLIDDYPVNLEEYLTNTDGIAFLVDQPWNRDHSSLESWLNDGRLFCVSKIIDIPLRLEEMLT